MEVVHTWRHTNIRPCLLTTTILCSPTTLPNHPLSLVGGPHYSSDLVSLPSQDRRKTPFGSDKEIWSRGEVRCGPIKGWTFVCSLGQIRLREA